MIIDNDTRFLHFAADKAAGDVATEALKANPEIAVAVRCRFGV